jgi:hypothetical protein
MYKSPVGGYLTSLKLKCVQSKVCAINESGKLIIVCTLAQSQQTEGLYMSPYPLSTKVRMLLRSPICRGAAVQDRLFLGALALSHSVVSRQNTRTQKKGSILIPKDDMN